MIYDLLILGISIWLLYDIFLMYKAKNKSQVLIEFILLAVLIAGYLINKLYETNYFVSDTYFYLGMVLAVINSNNSCNHIFIWISDSLDSILLDFNMILN